MSELPATTHVGVGASTEAADLFAVGKHGSAGDHGYGPEQPAHFAHFPLTVSVVAMPT